MSTRSIFGQDLSDYEIEVVLDNPAIAGWFEATRGGDQLRRGWRNDNSLRGKMMKMLAMAAGATGSIGTIKSLVNSIRSQPAEEIDEGRMIRRRPREIEIDGEGNIINEDEPPATRPRLELPELNLDSLWEDFSSITTPRDTSGNMNEDASGDVEMSLARSGGGGVGNAPSKETPISQYPSLTYGLQNTHTTIIPWRTWYSVAQPDHGSPIQTNFRMNSVYDMMITTLDTLSSGLTPAGKGAYIRPLDGSGANAAGSTFPVTPSAGTTTGERGQWRNYFAEIYEYYTVLGCEWKVTVFNPSTARGAGVRCGVQYDSYSDTATNVGNVMPTGANLSEALAFTGMQWHNCTEMGDTGYTNGITQFSGTYKPGMVNRNIVNDGDVKTWTATGSTTPNLKDILTLNWWQDELSTVPSTRLGVNVKVELKYIVQFKDLKVQARYPTDSIADQDLTQFLGDGANGDAQYRQA